MCNEIVIIEDPGMLDELRAMAEGWTDGTDGYEFWGTDAQGCEWRVHIEV